MSSNFIKKLIPEYRRIIENIFSLTTVQGANYILPLITFPYLVRILGPEKFGLLAFANAFVAYFNTIVDYGFVHTGPRRVAVNWGDKKKTSVIFNSIMAVKLGLFLVAIIVFGILVFTISKFKTHYPVFLLTFPIILGNALFPIWFFQGVERMRYITLLSISGKLLTVIAIFILIKREDEYLLVPSINSIGSLVTGVASLILINKVYGPIFSKPSYESIIEELNEGWLLFLSMSMNGIYYASTTFILGIFTSNIVVGYYKTGETIIRAITSLFNPISQALYPFISRIAKTSRNRALKIVSVSTLFVGIVSLVLSVLLFLFARDIVALVLGPKYIQTIIIIQSLSPLVMFTSVSGLLGVNGLLAFNLNKVFLQFVSLISGATILLSLILAPIFYQFGISLALLTAEAFGSIILIFYMYRMIYGTPKI